MSESGIEPFLQKPGSVNLSEIYILLPGGRAFDLTSYMMEFSFFEDIFSNTMSGYIAITDSRNLIASLPIVGDEYIHVSFITPSFPESSRIKRVFKVFSISNRKIIRDTSTTVYTLEFCSPELIKDSAVISHDLFDVPSVAPNIPNSIFKKYLAAPREAIVDPESLTWSFGQESSIDYNTKETANSAKVIIPGWSPLKVINWIASRSVPPNLPACNYLFYENNKGYKFYQVEQLIKDQLSAPRGPFTYYGTGIPDKDTSDLMTRVQALEFDISNDALRNAHSGYFANQMITLDLFKKQVDYVRYDHVGDWIKYTHTNGNESVLPTFGKDVKRAADVYTKVYPLNSKLFQNAPKVNGPSGINSSTGTIFGNRHSNIQDLTNLKLRILIPGRTDLGAGNLIKLRVPNLAPRDETDSSKDLFDTLYSGNYLITSIRHKIMAGEHMMTCELVTDSLLTTMLVA